MSVFVFLHNTDFRSLINCSCFKSPTSDILAKVLSCTSRGRRWAWKWMQRIEFLTENPIFLNENENRMSIGRSVVRPVCTTSSWRQSVEHWVEYIVFRRHYYSHLNRKDKGRIKCVQTFNVNHRFDWPSSEVNTRTVPVSDCQWTLEVVLPKDSCILPVDYAYTNLTMADLEAVLADVSYLMAMEKSKCTPAARASKKIVLPDPRSVSIEDELKWLQG